MDELPPVDWNRIVNDPGPSFVEEFDGYYSHMFDEGEDYTGEEGEGD